MFEIWKLYIYVITATVGVRKGDRFHCIDRTWWLALIYLLLDRDVPLLPGILHAAKQDARMIS